MKKEKYILVVDWNSWNPVHAKCMEAYRKDSNYNGTFKQFMRLKTSKGIMKENLEKYLNYCKDQGIGFEYIACGLKDEKIYIELESDNKRIASHLSYQANTSMNFMDYEGYRDIKIDGHIFTA